MTGDPLDEPMRMLRATGRESIYSDPRARPESHLAIRCTALILPVPDSAIEKYFRVPGQEPGL